jgi:hypothetical protein
MIAVDCPSNTDQISNADKIAESQGIVGGCACVPEDKVNQVMDKKKPRQGLDGVSDDPVGCCVVLRGYLHIEVRV